MVDRLFSFLQLSYSSTFGYEIDVDTLLPLGGILETLPAPRAETCYITFVGVLLNVWSCKKPMLLTFGYHELTALGLS